MTRTAFLVSSPRTAALRAINYARELELLRRPNKGLFKSTALSSLLSSCGDSYWAVFTRLDCAREHGVELITQTDMFAVEPEGRVIRRDSMPRPEQHEVERWQILISGAGQMAEGNLFGRSIVADARVAGRFLGPHAVALTFAEPGSEINLWTYAFLNSDLGFKAVKACAFGTSVPGIRLDLLREIPIPIPSDAAILSRVAASVRTCVEQRELYLRELQAARCLIEELPEMREADSMCAAGRARAAMWSGVLLTLNAWNYASAGEALPFLLRKWRARVSDFVPREGLFRGGRYQRVPCDAPFGIDFLSQRDVFSIKPISRRIVEPLVPRELVYVPEFSLLAGGQGTLGEGELFGQVALVTPDIATAGVTEHLLRVQPIDRAASALLYAFLSTLVGRRLLRTTGVGTKLLSLRPDLVFALPVPELSSTFCAHIVAHLERASAARVLAMKAEQNAIRTVEETLPVWLG